MITGVFKAMCHEKNAEVAAETAARRCVGRNLLCCAVSHSRHYSVTQSLKDNLFSLILIQTFVCLTFLFEMVY